MMNSINDYVRNTSKLLSSIEKNVSWGAILITFSLVMLSGTVSARTVPSVTSVTFEDNGRCSSYEIRRVYYEAVEVDDNIIAAQSDKKFYLEHAHRHIAKDGTVTMSSGSGFSQAADANAAIDQMNLSIFNSENPAAGTTGSYASGRLNQMTHSGGCATATEYECWGPVLSRVNTTYVDMSETFTLPFGACIMTVPPFNFHCQVSLEKPVVDFGIVATGSHDSKMQKMNVYCDGSAYYILSLARSPDGELEFEEGKLKITAADQNKENSNFEDLPMNGNVQGLVYKTIELNLDATFEKAGEFEWNVPVNISFY